MANISLLSLMFVDNTTRLDASNLNAIVSKINEVVNAVNSIGGNSSSGGGSGSQTPTETNLADFTTPQYCSYVSGQGEPTVTTTKTSIKITNNADENVYRLFVIKNVAAGNTYKLSFDTNITPQSGTKLLGYAQDGSLCINDQVIDLSTKHGEITFTAPSNISEAVLRLYVKYNETSYELTNISLVKQ